MSTESKIVITTCKILDVFSLIVNFVSKKFTIFIAGNAINTSIATEKMRVITMSIIF